MFLFLAVVLVVISGTNYMYYVELNTYEEYQEARKCLYCALVCAALAVVNALIYINS